MPTYAVHDNKTILNIVIAESLEEAQSAFADLAVFDIEDYAKMEAAFNDDGSQIINQETGEPVVLKILPGIGFKYIDNEWVLPYTNEVNE
jgi:hypothetical protein